MKVSPKTGCQRKQRAGSEKEGVARLGYRPDSNIRVPPTWGGMETEVACPGKRAMRQGLSSSPRDRDGVSPKDPTRHLPRDWERPSPSIPIAAQALSL